MKILVVVDMQNDFITGSLGTKEAQAIVPNVIAKIKEYDRDDCQIIFTRDTHHSNYLLTEEGKNLPIEHCIEGTVGWLIEPNISKLVTDKVLFASKKTFGSLDLIKILQMNRENVESIELIGLCTDICVISNAICCKSTMPNTPIYVDSSCCAGSTPEAHEKALDLMKHSLQIHVI